MHFLSILSLASLAAALPGRRPNPRKGTEGSVAYFLENDPAGNYLVSLHIASNGNLSSPIRTATGGYGSIQVNGTGFPDTTDTLNSQGSVIVADDMIFTVNAGSNSVSMFSIHPEDPQHPVLVGSPVNTLGEFPISVDYSASLRKACVLNGGAIAGIACFSVDPVHGLRADGSLHAIPRANINETTTPSGPTGSAAQVLFAPDASAVFATVKGNAGSSPPKLGSFLAWPVHAGIISTSEPVITQLPNITMDFGFQFLGAKTVYLADPSFGISLLTLQDDYTLVEKVHTVIPGQVAICWTQYQSATETLYAIDAGLNQIWTLSASTGKLIGSISLDEVDSTLLGTFDSAIAQGVMYSLTAANGISAVDLGLKKEIQFLDLSDFGDRQYYEGMAVWTSASSWGE